MADSEAKRVFNEDLLPHALRVIREDRVLKPGEVTGENIADGSIGAEKLLVPTGGSSAVGELEDLTVKVFEFENAGPGWNTQAFPEPFESRPCVVCSARDGYSVEIGEVSNDRFVYRLSTLSFGSATVEKYWLHKTNQVMANNLVEVGVVTAAGAIGTAGTAERVPVMCIAAEYGGE